MSKSRDKGNRFERDRGKWLLEHDGPCPKYGDMATVNARVGHITDLGFDLISRTYAGEAKHRESVPKWLIGAWKQIIEKAEKHGKVPFMAVTSNRMPVMHIITPEHHAELLEAARERDRLIAGIEDLKKKLEGKHDRPKTET